MLTARTLTRTFTRNMSQIRSAAILIIGDEILNGKIHDSNSHFFTKSLFQLGVEVNRILVVPDEEADIVGAIEYLKNHDLIVTSGGIGPTHDDITYESIGKAFNRPLAVHDGTVKKMAELMDKEQDLTGDARDAQLRMATFPTGDDVEVVYTRDDLWVPVVGIGKQVYILPGVPQLFETLLTNLLVHLKDRIVKQEFVRYFVKTTLRESVIAPHLSKLQKEVGDVKIGSYPHMGQGFTTISILGKEKDEKVMKGVVDDCVKELQGQQVTADEEKAYSEVTNAGFE